MKTHFFLTGAVVMIGTSLLATSFAYEAPEYLIFTRHRDSNGHLLAGPTHHQSQPSVIQKTVLPAQPQTFERQSTDWGMNAQEVKLNEPVQPTWELQSPILENYEQRVGYRRQIEGIDASLTYTFYEDQLAQANYLFEPKHDDAVDYIQDFHTVKNWITESYGMPTSVQEIWLDSLYQYDQSLWGQAVLRGHLKMVAEWRNDTTQITLLLDGGEDTIGLMADFDSVAIVPPAPMESTVMVVFPTMEETPIGETPITEEHSMEAPSVGDMPTESESQEPHPDTRL
ncbi:MAG: hypothetical protein OEZ41_00650 [Nitrospirota bacterium]|nr:hypothetical protein [Nitrospirota bacterium]MDH5698455.1 hypothetical protein [Nitrospirota bacterium]